MEFKPVTQQALLDQALALRRQVFVMEQGVPLEEEVDGEDYLSSDAHHGVILDDQQEVVATGRFISRGRTAKLQRICVDARYRGQGLGRILMQGLEQWAGELGHQTSSLGAQVSAIPFYQSLGYQLTDAPLYWDAGIEHRLMVKSLG